MPQRASDTAAELMRRAGRSLAAYPTLAKTCAELELALYSLCYARNLRRLNLSLPSRLSSAAGIRRLEVFLLRRGIRTLGLYGDNQATRELIRQCHALLRKAMGSAEAAAGRGPGPEVRFVMTATGQNYALEGVPVYHALRRDMPNVDAVIVTAPALEPSAVFAGVRAMRRLLSAPIYPVFDLFCHWAPQRRGRPGYQYLRDLSPGQYPEALRVWYRARTGQDLQLEHPQSLGEKIQWLKLYGMGPLQRHLTDKYQAKQWVAACLGPAFVTATLGRWAGAAELLASWEQLPGKFVLKCTHGSAMTIFVDRKSRADRLLITRRLEGWLSTDYAFCGGLELQYHALQPFIIAEPRAVRSRRQSLTTYRVWCFNAVPHFVEQCTDKYSSMFFDMHGQQLPFGRIIEGAPHARHRHEVMLSAGQFSKLLSLCRKLCAGLGQAAHACGAADCCVPLVRLDWVLGSGKWYFWDLTFSPDSGLTRWSDQEAERMLGALLQLPQRRTDGCA